MASALALLGSAWSCASIIGADFDKPFESGGASAGTGGAHATSNTASASTTASSGGGGGGGSDAGDDAEAGPGCAVMMAGFDATADTSLVSNNGVYGNDILADVNAGIDIRALLRFDLKAAPAAFQAIQAKTVVSLTLTLVHVAMTATNQTCGPGGTCPHAPGMLHVYPARNDWNEGTPGNNGDGATWTHRVPTALWGAPGAKAATDHGDPAALAPATGTFTGLEPTITVSLDPSVFTATWLDATQHQLSLLLAPESGLIYCFASKETGTLARAHLDISYCSGDQ